MMFQEIDASEYTRIASNDIETFNMLLLKIITCYKKMLLDKVSLVSDENKIRDALLIHYLRNNTVRKEIQLEDYLFDKEVPEDTTSGRTDIKIQTQNTFINTDAYYIIECKRLDNKNLQGKTGLNAKYIADGICRFVYEKYSCYHNVNALFGFAVTRLDIDKNIKNINMLLEKDLRNNEKETVNAHVIKKIARYNLTSEYPYSYTSTHNINNKNRHIMLYHLMFDFSQNIPYT